MMQMLFLRAKEDIRQDPTKVSTANICELIYANRVQNARVGHSYSP